MGRVVAVVIILAMIVFGGGFLWQQASLQESEKQTNAALAESRRSFGELARAAVRADDEGEYKRQILGALNTYEDELKRGVYADRPDLRDPTQFTAMIARQFEKGKLDEGRRKNALEAYGIVAEAYDVLKKGRWKSILNQAAPDGTRLDIYEMRRIRDSEGNPLLEARFFFWGIDDGARVSWGTLDLKYWRTVEKLVRRGRRKVVEDVEEVLGRASGDARPHIIIQKPQSFIAEFPSYVSVGYLWLPVMPRDAEKVDITYGYAARAGGEVQLKWTKLPIPERWQLKEGEDWDADVVEATPEEIAGNDD